MIIGHNIAALNAHRRLMLGNAEMSKSLERLSSGRRINKAADDAAGMAIAQKMDAQIRGLNQASRNAMDAISLIQTAEGAMAEINSILQRMRELAVQSANGTNTDEDRSQIQQEIDQLIEEIDRISTTIEFNTMTLLDGSQDSLVFQVGANAGQSITLDIASLGSSDLGVDGIDVENDADNAISTIDDAIEKLLTERSKLGAMQNRLDHIINNLNTSSENLTAALSRIEDVDMALEMSNYTKNNIILQAAQAMLAQANQMPQGVLQLLK
ncbi:MAG: flagellin [Clostridiaceae bacterium]|nr:flagellin [Clostridiaceae bacterium]